MNFKALSAVGLLGIAPLTAVLLAGCGSSSTLDSSPTGTELHGEQTLTIHIHDMGKRLELM